MTVKATETPEKTAIRNFIRAAELVGSRIIKNDDDYIVMVSDIFTSAVLDYADALHKLYPTSGYFITRNIYSESDGEPAEHLKLTFCF